MSAARRQLRRQDADQGHWGEYAELLEAAGVDTVRELKYRNPANLAKRMAEVNKRLKLVRALPSVKVVLRWIETAKKLSIIISY